MDSELIASGRDGDIYALGTDRVVRRARDGRSLAAEARVMQHVRAAGYPVPEVYELRAGDSEIVMDRLFGPSMLEHVGAKPWHLRSCASTLALLQRDLAVIEAPEDLPAWPGGGSSMLHLDFHPQNVILTANGPFVIDWTNARRGRPEVDVAMSWVIFRSSEIPGGRRQRVVANAGRSLLLSRYLQVSGRLREAEAVLGEVLDVRLRDPNLTAGEAEFLRDWRAKVS